MEMWWASRQIGGGGIYDTLTPGGMPNTPPAGPFPRASSASRSGASANDRAPCQTRRPHHRACLPPSLQQPGHAESARSKRGHPTATSEGLSMTHVRQALLKALRHRPRHLGARACVVEL